MAIKGSSKGKGSKKGNNESKTPASFTYANAGTKFWGEETLLTFSTRKNDDRGNIEMCVKINRLDEDKKFVKNEDGKPDCGFFSLSGIEIAKVCAGLDAMMKEEITGFSINHISPDTNTGSQLDITSEDDGIVVSIYLVEDGVASDENYYYHVIGKDQQLDVYTDEKLEETEKLNLNIELLELSQLFNGAFALISGLGEAVAQVSGKGGSSSSKKTGGKMTTKPKRETIKNAISDDDDEDDETDEEEAKPAKKKTTKKKKMTSSNMKKLLDDDED